MGRDVGCRDGRFVGCLLGWSLGRLVGWLLGCCDGFTVGVTVGTMLGIIEGDEIGKAVGEKDDVRKLVNFASIGTVFGNDPSTIHCVPSVSGPPLTKNQPGALVIPAKYVTA